LQLTEDWFVLKLDYVKYVLANFKQSITLENLARSGKYDPIFVFYFSHALKAQYQQYFQSYLNAIKTLLFKKNCPKEPSF
jgi:YesN/AraC family two-component response regulator